MARPFADNIKALLSDGIKASRGIFAGGGQSTSNAGYGWHGSPEGLFRRYAGSSINWDLVTADITRNPIAFTCLQIIGDNLCKGRIRVEAKKPDDDEYQPDPDHDLLPIFKHPNDFYSWDYLIKGVIASMHGQGNGFIGIERDGYGMPAELYWLPYGVQPIKDAGSKKLYDAWLYKAGNKTIRVRTEDIIHIPFGADPERPGFGMSVARVLKQSQYILQQGDNYSANVMRNHGASGPILSPKQVKDASGNIVQAAMPGKQITDAWKAKTTGDKVGEPLVMDYPLDVVFPNNTPQDLAIDTILDRPEANIAMVMRVSLLLVGAYAGRAAKTYNNMVEARQALWEECLEPLQVTIASALTTQLLSQMGGDVATERVWYDNSDVKALQPDQDELHSRVRNDFTANLIDLYTAEVETGRVPNDDHKNIYSFMLPHVSDTGQVAGGILAGIGVEEKPQEPQQAQAVVTAGKPVAQLPAGPDAAGKSWGFKATTSGEHWITVHGRHILLDEKGNPVGGGTIAQRLAGSGPKPGEHNLEKRPAGSLSAREKEGKHPATPEERKRLKVPPGYSHVHVPDDPDHKMAWTGVDVKGRSKRVYKAAAEEETSVAKFTRVEALDKALDGIMAKNDANLHSGKRQEEAAVIRLIHQTGFRPGSDRDTGGDEQAYGATTLRKDHVSVHGDTIHFQFTGKEGVSQDHKVTDPVLAKIVKTKLSEPGERLFNTTDSKLRDYFHDLHPGGFHPKDLRTWNGTTLAYETVAGMKAPTNAKEYEAARQHVASIVAHKLGNKPAVSLKRYIDPKVFSVWQQ